ncbi:hypothetical protein MMC17_005277 [Xylographa soralifera]|nr:hypothetical protein [Xylographa soralifera]
MVKPGKPKSKRTPVRLRHKIEKASAAKQRKQRKISKANPEWRSRLKKDPGIPNLFPYKDRILHEIEEKKRLKEEEFTRKRDEARAAKKAPGATATEDENMEVEEFDEEDELVDDEAMDTDQPEDSSNPMAALLASAKAQAAEYEETSDNESEDSTDHDHSTHAHSTKPQSLDSSRRAFTKTFDAVLDASDVLLYVLDARDPNGTRSRATERQIASFAGGSKRLILILNKIDLVPPRILKAWLVYLRRYFLTLPLRASNPAPNAKTFDHKALTRKATSETLLRALKSYAAGQNLKRAVTVGVVGYPNVGKSSVINALASCLGGRHSSRSGSTACPVGAEAGVTTTMREVKLDNKLKLLDCPGIVFPSATDHPASTSSAANAHLHLLSALPPSAITDPVPAISLLLSRLRAHSDQTLLSDLYATYNLPPLMSSRNGNGDGDVTTDFLVQVARKRGRLGKGGVPNLNSAAMGVLGDWRDGRVRGWVEAPVLKVAGAGKTNGEVEMLDEGALVEEEVGDRKEIVAAWGKEFKLEGLWGGGEEEEEEAAGVE